MGCSSDVHCCVALSVMGNVKRTCPFRLCNVLGIWGLTIPTHRPLAFQILFASEAKRNFGIAL